MAHHVDTVVEMEGGAVLSCCPHWHHTTMCFRFSARNTGSDCLSCALLVVGFVVILTIIPLTTIVPQR